MSVATSKICLVIVLFSAIAVIFYQQQVQYFLPTPIPAHYTPVALGQTIHLTGITRVDRNRPFLLHFYNPACPCSRFNIDHFQFLVKTYSQHIDFYLVLQIEDAKWGQPYKEVIEEVTNRVGLSIPIIVDTHKKIAQLCGVYSTPQAVLISKEGNLFYRGNYNRSRYCTSSTSNYAQQAVEALLKGIPSPSVDQLAISAYGCQLPDSSKNLASSLFSFE